MRGKYKLCLQLRDLQNPHLMPAALYRKSRTQEHGVIRDHGSIKIS
jgi:hypothetical protein